jgi:hypothetical protein
VTVQILNQELPLHEAATLRHLRQLGSRYWHGYAALLVQAGWTPAAIGRALGVTREAVRQAMLLSPTLPVGVVVASPPEKREATPVPPRRRLRIRTEIANQLRELHALARQVNGSTPADDPRRQASVDLTAQIAKLIAQGVITSEVAEVLGVHHHAIGARLARHGYKTPSPSEAGVHYLGHPAARMDLAKTHCGRGHELNAENVRHVNGDPKRRICRLCERARVAAYRTRKAGAVPTHAP